MQREEYSMETNVFMDKSIQPDGNRLARVLGENATFWEALKQHIMQKHGDFTEEWKFYNAKSGWTLKVLLKKRNLFFFTPLQGLFRLAFVFGDKAVAAVEKSDLPEALKNELRKARKYAEGRGIRIEVKSPKDVEHVKKLIDIKISN
ncbi:DUF3788 domain-containing protein [candidate division KSB1 bacterium]|nr:DUF3788 domain-containing protein [candidate division KSB1 bacterium]